MQRAWQEAIHLPSTSPKMGELKQEAVRNGVVQSRLEQLEERIQKLQLLEERIMSQYTAERARQSTGPMTAEPPGFALPNAPMDTMHMSDGAHMQLHAETAGMSRQNSLNSRGLDFLGLPRPLTTAWSQSQPFESRPTTMAGGIQVATRTQAFSHDAEMAVRDILRQELQAATSHKKISKELSFANVTDAGKESARSKDSSSTEDDIILPANDETVEHENGNEDEKNIENFSRRAVPKTKRNLIVHTGILFILTHVEP